MPENPCAINDHFKGDAYILADLFSALETKGLMLLRNNLHI